MRGEWEMSLIFEEDLPKSKRKKITNVGEVWIKGNPLHTLGGNANWCSPMENSMEVS